MPRERIATWPTGSANRLSVKVESLSAARTLTVNDVNSHNMWSVDPNGAGRNFDLPAAGACAGAYLFIANTADAAETLTVRDAAAATIVSVAQNKRAVVWCDGTAWYGVLTA